MPHSPLSSWTLLVFFLVMARAPAEVLYVDADATTGVGDGSTWSDALQGELGLRRALALAAAGDEIWVAEGTYFAATQGGSTLESFGLLESVSVYGGFAGGESSPSERPAIGSRPTILNGDLARNDALGQKADNSRQVVSLRNSGNGVVLDGFEIVGGYAFGTATSGAGLFWSQTSFGTTVQPIVRNCVFRDNHSSFLGGAVVIWGSPRFEGCTFEGNSSSFGGAIDIEASLGVVIDRCQFLRNEANAGGAIDLIETRVEVTNSLFVENTARLGSGGGLKLTQAFGSGAYNCTFVRNTASGAGGGIAAGTGQHLLQNLILWENSANFALPGAEQQVDVQARLEWSIIGGLPGPSGTNLGSDPLFVDSANDDFRVRPGSPAIDAGSSAAIVAATFAYRDLGRQRRLRDDPATPDTGVGPGEVVDIGAYEFPGGSVGEIYCPGAFNSSGNAARIDAVGAAVVAANDLTLVASGLPASQFGIFLASPSEGLQRLPGTGGSKLCLSGSIGRFQGPNQILSSGPVGAFQLTIDLGAIPSPQGFVQVQPGESWSFQAWFRDGGSTSAPSNTTDGTTVRFD